MKRFRAEGDFLIRALVTLVSTNRSHIHRLETELGEIAKLADQLSDLPRDLAKALHELNRQRTKTGLNPDELRERLDKLKELRVMPEDRADTGAE
jgi:DNA repair ATPase RecN